VSIAAAQQAGDREFQRVNDEWLTALSKSGLTIKAIEANNLRLKKIDAADTAWIRSHGGTWPPKPGPATLKVTGATSVNYTVPMPIDPIATARFEWVTRQKDSAKNQALQLLRLGHPKQAEHVLEKLLTIYHGDTYIAEILFDAQIKARNYSQAYATIIPNLLRFGIPRDSFGVDVDSKMRASLASALLGQVFDGQKQVCFNAMGYGMQSQPEFAMLMPKRSDAKTIAAMSATVLPLLTGTSSGQDLSFYSDLAQRLDPNEPMFALVRAGILAQRKQYRQAQTVLESAARTATGIVATEVAQMLLAVRRQAASGD
jgi:hypothetical protein